MNKKRKSILEEIEEFLEYLAKADENSRKEENLKKKFGEKRYKAIYNLIGGKYTGGLPKKEGNKRYLVLHINDAGLKFLEEQNQKKVLNEHSKTTLYITTILVLTTIFATFVGIKLAAPKLLIILYGIFAILITIYFKKNKVIKV
jgi:hypothetical protein